MNQLSLVCALVLAGGALVASAADAVPYFSGPIAVPLAKTDPGASSVVPKGIALTFESEEETIGAACFDLLLCRWAGAWTSLPGDGQPLLELHDAPGLARAHGASLFRTTACAGWLNANDSLRDPRRDPQSPLPQDWAQWRGLHVVDREVILEYTVQGVSVFELGAFKRKSSITWFERVLEIGSSTKPLTLVVCDAKGRSPAMREDVAEYEDAGTSTVALWDSPHGEDLILTWKLVDNAICLEIPPRTQPAHIAVRIWHGPADAQPDRGAWEEAAGAREPLPDLTALSHRSESVNH